MLKEPSIAETIEIMRKAHGVQLDKGGKPYWQHPLRVCHLLIGRQVSEDAAKAALLHDVLEDTELKIIDLIALGFSTRTIVLVEFLTRDKASEQTYMDWIRSIAAKKDRELILIKLADNEDNSDPERIMQLPESERSIAVRYARARGILLEALKEAK